MKIEICKLCGNDANNHEFVHAYEPIEMEIINGIIHLDLNNWNVFQKFDKRCDFPLCNSEYYIHNSIIKSHAFQQRKPTLEKNINLILDHTLPLRCVECNTKHIVATFIRKETDSEPKSKSNEHELESNESKSGIPDSDFMLDDMERHCSYVHTHIYTVGIVLLNQDPSITVNINIKDKKNKKILFKYK